jgi:hypothetical protein
MKLYEVSDTLQRERMWRLTLVKPKKSKTSETVCYLVAVSTSLGLEKW